MDHDQSLKTIIQTFFGDFIRLFFAEWAEYFDLNRAEWQEQEIFTDPPEGERRLIDLVAKVPVVKPIPGIDSHEVDEWLVMVMIEVDSADSATRVRSKIPYYYFSLRKNKKLPVLPIALFLNVGLNGIGKDVYEEHFGSLRTVRFEYLYAGLPALPAVEYFEGENLLGVALASLMAIPKDRIVELGAEAFLKIHGSKLNAYEKFLLGECVEAYLPLEESKLRELTKLLQTEKYSGVKAMNITTYERGIEKGRRELAEQTLKEDLEMKFESEGTRFFEQLPSNLNIAKLLEIRRAIKTAVSLESLQRFLD